MYTVYTVCTLYVHCMYTTPVLDLFELYCYTLYQLPTTDRVDLPVLAEVLLYRSSTGMSVALGTRASACVCTGGDGFLTRVAILSPTQAAVSEAAPAPQGCMMKREPRPPALVPSASARAVMQMHERITPPSRRAPRLEEPEPGRATGSDSCRPSVWRGATTPTSSIHFEGAADSHPRHCATWRAGDRRRRAAILRGAAHGIVE